MGLRKEFFRAGQVTKESFLGARETAFQAEEKRAISAGRSGVLEERFKDLEVARQAGEISEEEFQQKTQLAQGQLKEVKKGGTEALAGTFLAGTQALASPFEGLIGGGLEPEIQKVGEFGAKQFQKLPEGAQQAVLESFQKLGELGEENPALRDFVKGLANVGGLATVPAAKKFGTAAAKETVKQAPKLLKPIRAVGEAIEGSGLKSIAKRKESFIDKLIRPKETAKALEAQVGLTDVEGLAQKAITKLSKGEEAIKAQVLKIPELKPNMTLRKSFNVISKENVKKAEGLKAAIKKDDFIFPKKELMSELKKAKTRLAESPTLTSDALGQAEKILNKFVKFVDLEGAKGSGLLQARKNLDQWVKGQKPKAFDANTESAFSLALKEIRGTTNDFLDKKATSVAVKKSLKEQNNLFKALDNIRPKAAKEAKTMLGRVAQRLEKALGPNKLIKTIAGSAVLTPVAFSAPGAIAGATALGLALKGGKLAITNPQLRIQLGKALKLLSTKKGAQLGLSATAVAALQDDIRQLLGSE